MIFNIQKPALEREYRGEYIDQFQIRKEVCSLLKHKMEAIYQGLLIPDDLIIEAENFMERNEIEYADYQCCSKCLKAHVLKMAKNSSLSDKEMRFIEMMFPGEAGHDGYYLDGENLVKM